MFYSSRHQCLDFDLPSSCPTIRFVLQKLARMLTSIVIECSRQLMCTQQQFLITSRQDCQALLYHIVAMHAAFGDVKGDGIYAFDRRQSSLSKAFAVDNSCCVRYVSCPSSF